MQWFFWSLEIHSKRRNNRTEEEWQQLEQKQLSKKIINARNAEFNAIDKAVREGKLEEQDALDLKKQFHKDIENKLAPTDALDRLQSSHVKMKQTRAIRAKTKEILKRDISTLT